MKHIISRLVGRLANQMFCVVAGASYAKRNGYIFDGVTFYETNERLRKRQSVSPYIKRTIFRNINFIDFNDIEGYLPIPEFGKEHEYLKPGFSLEYSGNILMNDFFQDVSYIDRDVAFDLFGIYDSIKKEIRDLYGNLSRTVSVNIRRGDYLNLTGIGFKVWDAKKLHDVIDGYFPNNKVIFTSDDIQWCKDNFKGEKYIFADKPCNNKAEMDLYIQTQCYANIISNSTFSWWGAYLNKNDRVIYDSPWFAKNFYNGFPQIIPNWWKSV